MGVTSRLAERVQAHQQSLVDGFTKQHAVKRLVWLEAARVRIRAISREKQIKHWNREWKVRSIETINPYWNDLSKYIDSTRDTLGPRLRGDDNRTTR